VPTPLLAVIIALVVSQIATLCTTVYLHRALAHRALTIKEPLRFTLRFFTWVTTGIEPREWVAVHRKHHAFTDLPEDPHSPAQLGWVRVQLTNAALYRRAAKDPATVERYAKDLPPDAWDRVLFDHGLLGLAIGIAFLIAVLGPVWGLFAAVLHTILYLSIGGAVNSLGHHFGRRPYDNSATNMQWLAFLTGGEGLHNNHHAAPTSAKLSLHRGELDPGWWAISFFRRLGMAKVRLDKVVLAGSTGRRAA
jgi:stearoyl-CoA desaturase (delta-9 desaturase)